MNIFVSLCLVTFLGSFLQATSGFGAPIVMLIFFPHWFPYSTSVSLCHLIALSSTFYLVMKYRTSIAWKTLLPVLITSLSLGILATLLSISVRSATMTRALGFFFIAIAIFFMFFSNRMHIKATTRNGLITGAAAGICNGLFGISAPPTAIYFLSALDEKAAYMGTMQAFFFFSNIQSIIVRSCYGAFDNISFSYVLLGWCACLSGTFVGQICYKKIQFPLIKKIIYLFIALAGLLNIITSY